MKGQFQLAQLSRFHLKQSPNLNDLPAASRLAVEKLLCPERNALELTNEVYTPADWFYIDPQSNFTLGWNLVYLVVFYLGELQISTELSITPIGSTQMYTTNGWYLPAYYSLLGYWCLDCLLSFFKAYCEAGKTELTTRLDLIMVHYVKRQFMIDAVVIVVYCVPLVYQSQGVNLLQLIPMLLLWVKKNKYGEEIERKLQYRSLLQTVFLMTQLFSSALMISNYGACGFLAMDMKLYNVSYYGPSTNASPSPYYWLTNNVDYPISLIDGPYWNAYIWAQSWAAGTLDTMAPGPFPRNPYQALYVCVAMTLFMVLASYIGDVVVEIFTTYFEPLQTHQNNILYFDNFMHVKEVQKELRIKVNSYFELAWELQMKNESKEHEAMIQKLPSYLREELMMEISFTKHLHFLEYFSEESNSIKKLVALKIQRFSLDSGTCIFESAKAVAEQQRRVIYIKEGMAKFYIKERACRSSQRSGNLVQMESYEKKKSEEKEKILNLSNVSKILGVYQFVTGQSYTTCCKSVDLCLLQSLLWTDFWQIVQQLKIQQFHEIKHKVLYEGQLQHIDKLCVVCLREHIESECPELSAKLKISNSINLAEIQRGESIRAKRARREVSSKKTFSSSLPLQLGAMFMVSLLEKIEAGLVYQGQVIQTPANGQIEEACNFQHYQSKYNLASP